VNLSLVGNYLSSTFGTISDGSAGTIVYDPPGQPQTSTIRAHSQDNFTFRPDFGTPVNSATDMGIEVHDGLNLHDAMGGLHAIMNGFIIH
jgi:hypothetical protein